MAQTFSKDFSIDSSVFSTNKISLGSSTDANVVTAVLANSPFPAGQIDLGHISVSADTGKVSVSPNALPSGTSMSFDISASAQSGIGIYASFADAIAALKLPNPIDIKAPDVAGSRYLLADFGYSSALSGSASHPVGMLGSVSFGVDAKAASVFGLVHRFGGADGADTVLSDALGSWRLPRHVAYTDGGLNVKPGTWLIAELDGSLAFKLATSLGWNVSYAKDLTLLGVSHDLSAKIDASLTATFGFSVSGKYILVVGREDDSTAVRVRLSKQSSKGLNFGLNLAVGIQGADPQLPSNFDDFIKAMFGVHGLQVLTDLRSWTDPSVSIGQKIAGLADQTALDLLKSSTGIDPAVEFEKAKGVLAAALDQWDALPERLSSMLWSYLGQGLGETAITDFKAFLTDLSSPQSVASAFSSVLQKASFGDTPQGQFIEAIASQGLLSLAQQLPLVSSTAANTLNILNGGVIAELQVFINDRLNLDQIRKAVTDADFQRIDDWLKNRIANLLDRIPGLDDLKDVQRAIHTLDGKVGGYYQTAVKALTTKYSLTFAATYQKTTTSTALIDVVFDLSKASAATLFHEVIAKSNLDLLLTNSVEGVTLKQGALSHEISRKATVDLHMPLFDFTGTHLNDAIVKLTAEDQGGRLLLYQVEAKDIVTVANRTASQLSVLASLRLANGKNPELIDDGSIAYEMRQVKAKMRPSDLESRTKTFINAYLSGVFAGGDASLRTFYSDLDGALSAATGNQSNFLGDIALSMQLSLPAQTLSGWFRSRTAEELKDDQMGLSRVLQVGWKDLLVKLYFQDLSRYSYNESVAALLVWSSLPPTTNISTATGDLMFNRNEDPFWNYPDTALRRSVARDSHTVASLASKLTVIHDLLLEAGSSNANFFVPTKAGDFINLALNSTGDILFSGLLFTEAQLVRGAADALKSVGDSLVTAATAPTQAIKTLANFAAQLTDTFNNRVASVYAGMSGRAVGPLLLLQASSFLGSTGKMPSGVFSLYALKANHSFDLGTFIDGEYPPHDQIALSQTLVSLL